MNNKQITKQYQALLEEVKTNEFYTKVDLKNRVNCYTCQTCKLITKTIDIHAGVTPFIHRCEHCGEMAHSSFYKDIAPHLLPTQEWFRPELSEVLKMNGGLLDHILQGGLDVRSIGDGQYQYPC